ncbi:MAG: ATP-grasp fold amidoligase family protein, partial [Brevefilum sp.]|nr:ATP-grasp fold amidoligase family protein [Brevefilum sp.]
IGLAQNLSEGLPFVRVDFYLINDKPYIGEMTFHPGSGFSIFHPQEWDEIIGGWFDISSFYPQ